MPKPASARSTSTTATPKTKLAAPAKTKVTAEPVIKPKTGWEPSSSLAASMTKVSGSQAASTVNMVTAAQAVSPGEALKLVKNGDVDIAMPLGEGKLKLGGFKVNVRPNTVMKLSAHVKDGVIDFAKTEVKFEPPIDFGPMGNDVAGAKMTADGRIRIDVNWLPDPKIGGKAPAKLSEFVDYVTTMKELPVKMLGVKVSSIPTSSTGASKPATNEAAGVLEMIDPSKTTISVKNVSFHDGKVPMGNMGSVQLGADSKLELSGTLNNLKLTGRASIQQLDLDASGTHVKGTRGSADISVQWNGDGLKAKGTVTASLKNFNLNTESAISRRENGDFIELAKGSINRVFVNHACLGRDEVFTTALIDEPCGDML